MRNLGTKENRLHDLKCQFEYLTKGGYTQEAYKDLNIFTLNKDGMLILKVFRGTSTNPVHYIRYRTPESLEKVVGQYKASADRREKEKEDNKGKRTLTGAALCALAIREELKKEFPAVKFSVKSSNFAGGNSVHISWNEGPTSREVDVFTNKYQYGSFDGMTDMYNYSNTREDLPQSKYVSTRREISEEVNNVVFESLKLLSPEDRQDYEIKQDCYRIISKTPFKPGATVTGVTTTGQNGSIEDFYTLTFLLPETPEAKETPNFEAVEVPEGQIQIIDYSEKAIAVIGNTKPIKELLKSLGGSFNPRLSCGAGWIFSKKKLEEVQTALINHAKTSTEEPQPENINLPVLYTSTPSNVQNIEEAEIIEEPAKDWRKHPELEHRHPLNICDPESNQYKEALKEYEAEHPKKYKNIIDITAAAKSGKPISIYNLFDIVNTQTVNA
jgi:hypothetical protein